MFSSDRDETVASKTAAAKIGIKEKVEIVIVIVRTKGGVVRGLATSMVQSPHSR